MTNEKQSLADKRAFFSWKPAAWLKVSGADSFTFLQGQFTNDLRKLKAEPAVYGLWLNQKGKVLADSFVVRGRAEEEFWIGSYASEAAAIRERLEGYIIADDVVIEDLTADWSAVTVFDAVDGGDASVGAPADVVCFPGRRGTRAAWEWLFPPVRERDVLAVLDDARELSTHEMERLRIAAGIAKVPQDIGAGELPNEGGLDAVAISYTKGCYLGQEVMARLKSMGTVRRQLRRIQGSADMPAALPAPLFQGEKKIGELRSAVKTEGGIAGLALISLINAQLDAPMALDAKGTAVLSVEWP